MKKTLFILVTAVAVALLAGCEQERMPEPNAATCAPDAFQAALNEMRSEANRAGFTDIDLQRTTQTLSQSTLPEQRRSATQQP